MILSATLWTQY